MPLKYQEIQIKLRHIGVIMIWILSIGRTLSALMTQTFDLCFYLYYRDAIIYLFYTIPIVSVIVMYMTMIYILREKRKQERPRMSQLTNNQVDAVGKKMTLMVQRVVICLLICFIPYLVWCHYFNVISVERGTDWHITTVEVICFVRQFIG